MVNINVSTFGVAQRLEAGTNNNRNKNMLNNSCWEKFLISKSLGSQVM